MAIGDNLRQSKVESKTQSFVSFPSNTTSDVSISNFNKMNSFACDSSHSSPFEILPLIVKMKRYGKQLIKVVENHENQTSLIKDIIC